MSVPVGNGRMINGISGLGVSGSCGGEGWAVIQRGHLDDRVPALAMTRCHAGLSRILSRTPTNPATISVASSSERVSSCASSLSLAGNWRASSCRVMPVASPRSGSLGAGGDLAAAPRLHQLGWHHQAGGAPMTRVEQVRQTGRPPGLAAEPGSTCGLPARLGQLNAWASIRASSRELPAFSTFPARRRSGERTTPGPP